MQRILIAHTSLIFIRETVNVAWMIDTYYQFTKESNGVSTLSLIKRFILIPLNSQGCVQGIIDSHPFPSNIWTLPIKKIIHRIHRKRKKRDAYYRMCFYTFY